MTVGRCGDTADIVLNRTRTRVTPRCDFLTFFSAFLLYLLILSASLFAPPAKAQDAKPGVVGFGDLVVTGASGTLPPPANPPLPPGVNQLDETFINPDGASLKVFDVRNPGGPAQAQLLNAATKYQALARDIGQVFGLALDKSNPPNIFAASTSVHGLQIVVPDADGDGRPERIKIGQPGAQWMDGQFGLARGGGPGTVWKINGETGEITKFVDILNGGAPNSGPGLGNIAYDDKHKQLFVSDLDSGLIHRLDMTGTDLGTFDHGLQSRPANGMTAAADDAVRADITSPAFDAEDSGSWGLTAPERRVWGLAFRGNRIYYAVEAGPQIWSVGINKDGGFGGDPRWELDVPSDPNAYPVSDIAFTGKGQMLLAQRGGIVSRYDYSQYHTPRKTRVLRYRLESPDDAATPSRWVEAPDDYAIGFPGIHRNTSGGIAIGYGYKRQADGSYGFGSCEGTLWSTGDALRDNPVHGAKLAQGGPLNVHGLQGNALSLVRPQNVPPWASYYVDFDGQFDDPQASGHVGDVEIPRECKRKRADLRILKKARPERCTAGNSCTYEIEIENVGSLSYSGPLAIREEADGGAKLVSHSPPPPHPGWECKELFPGTYECTHPPVTLAPGEKTSLELTFQLPPWWDRNIYRNCVDLPTPGFDKDSIRYNNRSCDYVPTIEHGHPHYAPDLQLEKFGVYGNCDWFGNCHYVIRITNVGAADYTGPLHIHDTITTPGSAFIDWGPKPQWNCGPVGGNAFDCSRGVVTLSPGEFREVHVFIVGPPLGLGHIHELNCALIDWKGAPGDINPFNEYDCAGVSLFPPGHPLARPKLAIDKSASPHCWLTFVPNERSCEYSVTITNTGGAPYEDPFVIDDTTELIGGGGPGTLRWYWLKPPWTCAPDVNVPGPQTCQRPPVPGGLQPGESTQLMMAFKVLAAATPDNLKNCAKITHDNDGDGVAEDIENCATAQICIPGAAGDCPQDLALEKAYVEDTCWPGFPCHFGITVTNLGSVDFPAGLEITDIPNPDVGAFTQINPPAAMISCVPAGTNQTCTVHDPIPPGGSSFIAFQFDVPPAYPWTTLKNCASIPPDPAGNTEAFNDEDCATVHIPGPDLAPFGGTECTLGVPCPLDVTIDNKGLRPFKGAAGLKGTLSPAVQITSINSQTAGLSCSVTGNGTYKCDAPSLELAPGASAKLNLTILVPKSFKGTQISHIKDMVWPDSKVKDRNPSNDQHISIITIEQPKKPPPVAHNCPVGWSKVPPSGAPSGWKILAIDGINPDGTKWGLMCMKPAPVVHNCPEGWTKVPPSGAPSGWKVLAIDGINPDGTKWGLMCMKPAPPQPPPAGKPDLAVTKTANQAASRTGGPSGFTVTITNVGNAPISGPINIQDTITPSSSRLTSSAPPPWRCRGSGGSFGCSHPPTTLQPGQSKILSLTFTVPRNASGTVRNCAEIRWGGASQTRSSIRNVQSELTTRGFNPGPADGKPGRKTTNAIRAFQAQQGLRVTGRIDPALIARLFGSPGSGDSNPANDRACAVSSIIGQPKPPPPPICTGGRSRNNYGICVCPSYKPVWTGSKCILPPPQQCTGGRVRNNKGACVCPANKPVWTGQNCIPRPVTCTGGRFPNNKGQCVCPSNLPIWTGQICIPKINICSGGRVFSLKQKKCVCPSSKPVWDNKNKKCKARTVGCTGGRNPTYADGMIKCTCPKNKPFWTGSSCTQYTTNPGFPKPSPGSEITPGPSQISCSGGRDRNNNGQCVCPANKPMWFGGKCNALKLQKPGIKLPPGIKYPGIKIQ